MFLVGKLPIKLYVFPHGGLVVEFHSSLEKYPSLFGDLSSSPSTIVAYVITRTIDIKSSMEVILGRQG
jgi:hypothetical protein